MRSGVSASASVSDPSELLLLLRSPTSQHLVLVLHLTLLIVRERERERERDGLFLLLIAQAHLTATGEVEKDPLVTERSRQPSADITSDAKWVFLDSSHGWNAGITNSNEREHCHLLPLIQFPFQFCIRPICVQIISPFPQIFFKGRRFQKISLFFFFFFRS